MRRPPILFLLIFLLGTASAFAGTGWWTPFGPGSGSHLRFLTVDAAGVLFSAAGPDIGGDVYRGVDGGRSWGLANGGLAGTTVVSIAADPDRPGTLYAGSRFPSAVYRTTDGGAAWGLLATFPDDVFLQRVVVLPGASPVLLVQEAQRLFRSTDGGASFATVVAAGRPIGAPVFAPSNPRTVYLGTSDPALGFCAARTAAPPGRLSTPAWPTSTAPAPPMCGPIPRNQGAPGPVPAGEESSRFDCLETKCKRPEASGRLPVASRFRTALGLTSGAAPAGSSYYFGSAHLQGKGLPFIKKVWRIGRNGTGERKMASDIRTIVPALLCALLLGACGESAVERNARQLTGGKPGRGKLLVRHYGCNTCHLIPGLSEPKAQVGPPLRGILSRPRLAGRLPNTPENLIRWIRDPQSVARGTLMPTLGVTEEEGRDLAAFLYTLR